MRIGSILTSLLVIGFSGAAARADECKLEQFASIPAHLTADDELLLDATLNGTTVKLDMSTYLPFSALGSATVDRMGLPRVTTHSGAYYFGRELSDRTQVPTLAFGGIKIEDEPAPILPATADRAGGPDGVLGSALWRQYNIEVDLAGGVVRMFKPNGCNRAPVYWAQEWFELPLEVGRGRRLAAYLQVDGKNLHAVLDTGSPHSVLTATAAQAEFGLGPESPGMESLGSHIGPDGFPRPQYRHTIGTLVLGSVTLRNVQADVWPIHPTYVQGTGGHIALSDRDQPELFVGMHELKKFRFYVDYGAGRMYFTLASAKPSAT
jgi:hypothetical protein